MILRHANDDVRVVLTLRLDEPELRGGYQPSHIPDDLARPAPSQDEIRPDICGHGQLRPQHTSGPDSHVCNRVQGVKVCLRPSRSRVFG